MSDKRWAWGLIRAIAFGLLLVGMVVAYRMFRTEKSRIDEVRDRVTPTLSRDLRANGLALGNAAFIRIFKEENELELWLQPKPDVPHRHHATWKVAARSGNLGPKQKEGDRQAPEGFYSVGKSQLNPNSNYHLAFNIGYPNAFDLSLGRTGSFIMVHGSDVSIGCFAMTDPVIEEIYLIVEAALNKGQTTVPVHVFPFRMTEERMSKARGENSEWLDFWSNLKEGHDLFETQKLPPAVSVESGKYSFHL